MAFMRAKLPLSLMPVVPPLLVGPVPNTEGVVLVVVVGVELVGVVVGVVLVLGVVVEGVVVEGDVEGVVLVPVWLKRNGKKQ